MSRGSAPTGSPRYARCSTLPEAPPGAEARAAEQPGVALHGALAAEPLRLRELDVVAVGHAIVDRIGFVTDSMLEASDLVKGSMRLVGELRELAIEGAGTPRWEWAAGSAGNTAAALALLGSAVCFVGRVGDDELGAAYRADMGRLGAQVQPDEPVIGAPTGRCMVLVTPDGERTMSTYLGASTCLGRSDLPADLVASARVCYVEGYLWDSPSAVDAIRAVLPPEGAPTVGTPEGLRGDPPTFALSLSDPFCVQRHRDAFTVLVEGPVGVLFANEAEALALTGTAEIDEAVVVARGWGGIVAITRGGQGSVVVHGDYRCDVPALAVPEVVDTTGAGDLYAAGFLHGLVNGFDLERCAQLGSLAASEVIGHVGARPMASLRSLAVQAGLLPPEQDTDPPASKEKT